MTVTSSGDRLGGVAVLFASLGTALTAVLTIASYTNPALADATTVRPGTVTVGALFLAVVAATLLLQIRGATTSLTVLDALFSGRVLTLAAVGVIGCSPLLLAANLPMLQVAAAVIVIAWATTGARRAHRRIAAA